MTISNFVAYVKQMWKNKPDTSTPLSADRLLHIEDGIKGNSDAIKAIAAAVVSQIVNDPDKIASMAALYAVNQKIGDVANLPNSAADVVTAITQQNSNLTTINNEHKIKSFTNIDQLGILSDYTPSMVLESIPDYSDLLVNIADLTSSEWNFPITLGTLHIVRYVVGRCFIFLYGKESTDGDYRMFLTTNNKPTGIWVQTSGSSKKIGSGSTGAKYTLLDVSYCGLLIIYHDNMEKYAGLYIVTYGDVIPVLQSTWITNITISNGTVTISKPSAGNGYIRLIDINSTSVYASI